MDLGSDLGFDLSSSDLQIYMGGSQFISLLDGPAGGGSEKRGVIVMKKDDADGYEREDE